MNVIGRPSLCESCEHAHCTLCRLVDQRGNPVLGQVTLQPVCHLGGAAFAPSPLNPVVECDAYKALERPREYQKVEDPLMVMKGAGNGRTSR